MRIPIATDEVLLKLAKSISKLSGINLSVAQNEISKSIGYRDFHDLKSNLCGKTFLNDFGNNADNKSSLFIDLVISLSSRLGVNQVDCVNAIHKARIIPRFLPTTEQLMKLMAECFEKSEFQDLRGKVTGQVCRVKPWKNELVLLRHIQSDGISWIFSHKTQNSNVMANELVVPREKAPLFIPYRLYMPYGYITEPGGEKVVFSRDYVPMWRVGNDKKCISLSLSEELNYPKYDATFLWESYGTMPLNNHKEMEQGFKVMEGLGVWGVPNTVKLLPFLLRATGNVSIKEIISENLSRLI